MNGAQVRQVARVVVIDPEDRVLLFDTRLAYTRVWMAPGGAVEQGETYEEAAARELWEEAGIRADSLSPCLWTLGFVFEKEGRVYDQRERYFAAHATTSDVHAGNREASERSQILEHRWWTLAEILGSSADFRPRNLAALLHAVLAGAHADHPLEALVERSARLIEPRA